MSDIYTQRLITVEEFVNMKPYRGQMLGKEVKLNKVNFDYIEKNYSEVMYDSPQRPAIYNPPGTTPMVIVGNHRQGVTRKLLLEGAISKTQKIPVQFILQKCPTEKLTKIAVVSNQRNATGNSKEMQVLGEAKAATNIYKPILEVFDSLELVNISRATQIQSALYLGSLINYNTDLLKRPKGIKSCELYSQRKTAMGSTTRANYLEADVFIDLRDHKDTLSKLLTPAFKMLDRIKDNEEARKTLGNSRQIAYLMIMLSARGWIETRDVQRSRKITYNNFITFFTDKKYTSTVREWLIDVNNKPEDQGINFIKMLKSVKKDLPKIV